MEGKARHEDLSFVFWEKTKAQLWEELTESNFPLSALDSALMQ